jgi:hypothetical protein
MSFSEYGLNLDQPRTPPADHYLWEIADKGVSVRLHYDVVDRLLLDVMHGYGLVPRRGAEVGGLLLGSAEQSGDRTIVTINDFRPVPCEHQRGPSFLLSESDRSRFQEACQHWRKGAERRDYAVGFYRSHTREGLGLASDDLDLFDKYFPGHSDVILLVKPFATRASVAGFFFREGSGMRTDASYLEFPFRRRELGGTLTGEIAPAAESTRESFPLDVEPPRQLSAAAAVATQPPAEPRGPVRRQAGWTWIPLSFVFLLIGVVLGFQAAGTIRMRSDSAAAAPFSLALRATPSGDSLHVKWDRQAPAIRAAKKGALLITDGDYSRTVDLDLGQLRNGSVIYRHLSDRIIFRLEIFPSDRAIFAETVEVRATAPAARPQVGSR